MQPGELRPLTTNRNLQAEETTVTLLRFSYPIFFIGHEQKTR